MNKSTSCSMNAPNTTKRISFIDTVQAVVTMSFRQWIKAFIVSIGAAVIIGIPTVIIPNPLFQRMIPVRPIDIVFFVVSVSLIGVTWALSETQTKGEKQSFVGFVATIFAVGCPTCNQIVLMLLGAGGAMTYFAPIQPIIGAIAVSLLLYALMRRVASQKL